MCVTCGCGNTEEVTLSLHEHDDQEKKTGRLYKRAQPQEHVHADGTRHTHTHDDHSHEHEHTHADGTRHSHSHPSDLSVPDTLSVPGRDAHTIQLEAQILGKNQLLAERNRGWLAGRGIFALNLVSSPGAGKTTLLERTLGDLKAEIKIGVVEGDQATSNDAQRIRATGVPAVQINTGTGCHLEADMLERALTLLKPEQNSLLLIENVGNLVCPALFDLGEKAKVVIFSVTEGEDKPLKYPHMFSAASVLILSKMDLLPHVRFDVDLAIKNALTVNPKLKVFQLSSYTGAGMAQWYDWLKSELTVCAESVS
ncbi:MAG: hydrogenase nickel incorporation protein HypB [Gallionellaceae bacterium]|nr:hydrogenase nickel incorporation protein HypB [Gallionellaceae bacterium]